MELVIGLDYGNYYAKPVVILDMDPVTRRGGIPMDLRDVTALDPYGFPTAFFRSARRNNGQPIFGYEATKGIPATNIVRCLKRQMGQTVVLDGVGYSVDDMITATIQYCIRGANRQLYHRIQQTTNRIGLAYPATFSEDQRRKLIRLAEAATLEDGRHLEVVGTISEPVAVALDYQATCPQAEAQCIMVYDMGAGALDLAVVNVSPATEAWVGGNADSYDTICSGGIGDLGGETFSRILYDLAVKKLDIDPTPIQREWLMRCVEVEKKALFLDGSVSIFVDTPDGVELLAEITREEFDREARPFVMRTVAEIRRMLEDPNVLEPQIILLTGGASHMPVVREVLEEQFPQYRGRILLYCPGRAVAQGAARFAARE